MFIRGLSVKDVRTFREAEVQFALPGDGPLSNVTLLLGDNGTGKTALLSSVAIACLGPALEDSGFLSYFQVRRARRPGKQSDPKEAQFKAELVLHHLDSPKLIAAGETKSQTVTTSIVRRGEREVIRAKSRGDMWTRLYEKSAPGLLVLGYGATRRVDRSNSFDPSQSERQRGARYQRVAGLFEDHVPLIPVGFALKSIQSARPRGQAFLKLLNRLLPDEVKYKRTSTGYQFEHHKMPLPFWALSDGYRAYIGMVLDLLWRLLTASKNGESPTKIPALVLIDEIDLHLHPSWQRRVVPHLAKALPFVQFIVTTHSPIVAGTVPHENVRILERDGQYVNITQSAEDFWGKSADEILLGQYFGLSSTRAPEAEGSLRELSQQALDGDSKAAIRYLDILAGRVDLRLSANDEPRVKKVATSRPKVTNSARSRKK